ncbi:MAG: DUF1064 domain-containing protein [Oscillibacter sp.]
MAISVTDLPPKYQAQALKKCMEQQKKRGAAELAAPAKGPAKKFHNVPTARITENGNALRFDSQKEARRYDYLTMMERNGKIKGLRLQTDFTLQEAYTDREGRRVRAIRYKADFTYYQPPSAGEQSGIPWEFVVEDVKSRPTRTKEYIIKKKMLKDHNGIDITEV